MRPRVFVSILFIVVCNHPIFAQDSLVSNPKTKLEAFTGEVGSVIVKGYAEIGVVKAQGEVSVTAMTFKSAKTGSETKGLVLEISEYGGYGKHVSRSFVDYDEIGELLEGVDYIAKANESVTPYPFFEAKYATRGGLSFTVFNDLSGKLNVAIASGSVGARSAYLNSEQFSKLRLLIVKAQEVLNNPALAVVKRNAPEPSVMAPVRSGEGSPARAVQSAKPLILNETPKPAPAAGGRQPSERPK
ncbi:hypothetical protein RHODGE_RHODGE_03256 [Rhodoplanes serenus]|uniref:Uncharacterized protein n=1 Tax=Rhodoplanes serenus TaxID=200615 RepID=A0A447CXQ7_9BRAD|nr:hypothetical protein [Rhodoplanes serenus]MBI5112933.1 hypothetical protein [Rhodovulum sp.]VCU10070.1 hypothetical protein RHODGE_RHODGE_03256 [Rhodoplanes serenus]